MYIREDYATGFPFTVGRLCANSALLAETKTRPKIYLSYEKTEKLNVPTECELRGGVDMPAGFFMLPMVCIPVHLGC